MYLLGVLLSVVLQLIPVQERTGVMYVGDSRFVGMNNACAIIDEEDTWVVAKVGEGLRWLKSSAINDIYDIVAENTAINSWTLVIGLGVNDLYNAHRYVSYYDMLSNDFKIILVSVNPVNEQKCSVCGYTATNSQIADFNKCLINSGYEYLDVYSILMLSGFNTVDGLHYTDDTYNNIYTIIKGKLNYEVQSN